MNRKELVYTIRNEAYEIEAAIKKLQQRSDNLKSLADDLEAATKPPEKETQPPGKFRKIVDSIYGEKPKKAKS